MLRLELADRGPGISYVAYLYFLALSAYTVLKCCCNGSDGSPSRDFMLAAILPRFAKSWLVSEVLDGLQHACQPDRCVGGTDRRAERHLAHSLCPAAESCCGYVVERSRCVLLAEPEGGKSTPDHDNV